MDYGKLISQSASLAWRHKLLWIFGLFTGAGSAAFHHEWPNDGDYSDWGRFGEISRKFQGMDFDVDPDLLMPLLGGLMAFGMLIWLAFMIANLIATPALIDSVNNITRGTRFSFGNSLSRGVDYFWKMLGLLIIGFFAWMGSMVIGIPIMILLIITIIGIPVAIGLIFFIIYFWFTLFSLAERAIVVRDCSVTEGLNEGWVLLKANFSKTLMMGLIYFCLSIAAAIIGFIIWSIIAVPMGGLVGLGTGSTGMGIMAAIIVSLPIWIVVGGYSGTAFSSLYTMFYFELVQPGSMTGRQTIGPPDDFGQQHPINPTPPIDPALPDDPTPPDDPGPKG